MMQVSFIPFLRTYRKLSFGSIHSFKRYLIYVLLVFTVLLMSWEANAMNIAIVGEGIPEQSIRLRILANSDSPADQWLKHKVRDAVVDQMNTWVSSPDQIEQARTVIRENIPEIRELVQGTIRAYGFDYDVDVELGEVDFPTKIYGNKVYPAGVYEALRISIGKAEGQNWWCVLFPPLCFVDMATGSKEAVAKPLPDSEMPEHSADTASAKRVSEQEKEARFFFWDLLQDLFRWIGSWF